MYERNSNLLISKLKQYLIPAILMKLALQLGNVVDTVLVGNILGTEAMSAVNISMPILTMVQIPAILFGNGGATYAGILLGKRQRMEAGGVFTICLLFTLFLNFILFILSFFISDPLARLLSGGGILERDVASCVFIYLCATPIQCMGIVLSRFFSADSHPRLSSAYYIISNTLNLIFDFILLKYTDLGVKASALSTLLGFSLGILIVIFYVKSKTRMLSLVKITGSFKELKNILSFGAPHFANITTHMISGILINMILLSLLNQNGIVVITVINNLNLIIIMLIGGIIETLPYVVSILYGENDYYGIREIVKKVFRYSIPIVLLLMMLLFFVPGSVSVLFGIQESYLEDNVSMVMRFYAISIPLKMISYFVMEYYGAIETPKLSTLASTFGNGLILAPCIFLCVKGFQAADGNPFVGLAIAVIISELITIVASYIYKIKKYPGRPVLLIPEKSPNLSFDITIRSEIEQATEISERLQAFCKENAVSASKSALIALAAEEMTVNIIKYGGNTSKWIDICLILKKPESGGENEQSQIVLKLRDNGVPFDPTTYEYDTTDTDYVTHGIKLVKQLANSVSYIRAMDLNSTTITMEH